MGLSRLQLQTDLEMLMGLLDAEDRVFFQPPSNVSMVYPCIVYKMDDLDSRHADNKVYRSTRRYQVTVIDRDPDSALQEKVALLPLCTFDRSFSADDLNHWVFNLYY